MNVDTIPFRCRIEPSMPSAPLAFEIILNGKQIYYNPGVDQLVEFEHEIEDLDDVEHELVFIMSEKTIDFTKIDEQGNIVSDSWLSISDLYIDDIDINQIFIEKNTYVHNFNGTQDEITDQFFGTMGCNGRVTFKFTTPFYLWLLESM